MKQNLMRLGLVVLAASLFTAVAPHSASAAGTPRAQFWSNTAYAGDKLDKDVTSSGTAYVADLTNVGRNCTPFSCWTNWNDQISSLSTAGGGQAPVHLVVYEHANRGGACLYIGPNLSVSSLDSIPVWTVSGTRGIRQAWNDRISSFDVSTTYPPNYQSCDWYDPWF